MRIGSLVNSDVGLTENSCKESGLWSKFCKCQTRYGRKVLLLALQNSFPDTIDYKKRQDLLTKYANKDISKLSSAMGKIGLNEDSLEWLLEPPVLTEVPWSYLYGSDRFVSKVVRKVPGMTEISQFYLTFLVPLVTFGTPLLMVFIPFIVMKYFGISDNRFAWELISMTIKYALFGGGIMSIVKSITTFAYISMTIYNLFQTLRTANTVQKLAEVSRIHSTAIEEINEALCVLKELDELVSVFFPNSESLSEEIIYPKTWKGFFEIVENETNKLDKLKTKISLYDATLSIIKTLQSPDFSVVNFCLGSCDSWVKIKGMKAPHLPRNSVPNDFELKDSGMLITGPNAAGKSCYVKAIITNIIIAHSVGIAMAEEMDTFVIDYIQSHVNVSDKAGQSLFQAEVERTLEVINAINENQKIIYFLDEPFHSTPPKEGEAAAFAAAKTMTNAGAKVIVTTHYHGLEPGLRDAGFQCKYFSAKADSKRVHGFDYRVKDGFTDQCIAFQLLDEKIKGDFIQVASNYMRLYQEPKNLNKIKC